MWVLSATDHPKGQLKRNSVFPSPKISRWVGTVKFEVVHYLNLARQTVGSDYAGIFLSEHMSQDAVDVTKTVPVNQ